MVLSSQATRRLCHLQQRTANSSPNKRAMSLSLFFSSLKRRSTQADDGLAELPTNIEQTGRLTSRTTRAITKRTRKTTELRSRGQSWRACDLWPTESDVGLRGESRATPVHDIWRMCHMVITVSSRQLKVYFTSKMMVIKNSSASSLTNMYGAIYLFSLPQSKTCSGNTIKRCISPSICEHGIRALWLCLVLRRSQLSLSHMKTCTSEDKLMKHPSRLRFVNFTLQLKRTWVASQSSQKQITQKPTGLSRRVRASRIAKKRSRQKRNRDATEGQEKWQACGVQSGCAPQAP